MSKKTGTFGNWMQRDATLLNLHTDPISWGLLPLNHGKDCGNLGLLTSAKCFFGWKFGTDVGQRIGWPREDYHTLIGALFVIRRGRQCSIF